MPATAFTDKRLKQLYSSILRHYNGAEQRGLTSQAIIDEIYSAFHYSWQPAGDNYDIRDSKIQAYAVLETLLRAKNSMAKFFIPRESYGLNGRAPLVAENVIKVHVHEYYHRDDSFLRDWLLINALTNNSNNNRGYGPSPFGYGYGGGSSSNSSSQSNQKKDDGSAAALLLLVGLGAAAVAATFIAMYYLLRETVSSFERFFYNEGWMQAALTLLSMPASLIAANMLAMNLAADPLLALAISAGVSNPVGTMVIGIACLSIIGAAAGCLITNQVQQFVIAKLNSESIDVKDPYRVSLTHAETDHLKDAGLDPIKVKCAMIAARAKMGTTLSPLLHRWFTTNSQQAMLDTIRKLRSGLIIDGVITVGDMRFDLRDTGAPFIPNQDEQPGLQPSHDLDQGRFQAGSGVAPVDSQVQPSAPPVGFSDQPGVPRHEPAMQIEGAGCPPGGVRPGFGPGYNPHATFPPQRSEGQREGEEVQVEGHMRLSTQG